MPSLHNLIEEQQYEEFEELLTRNPDLANERSPDGDTPLHIAAWQDEAGMLQRLLEVGADIDARGDSGFAPLHYAAKHGSMHSTQILIEMGANLDARDDSDFWPIHYALRGREPGCPEIADLLEAAGAPLDLSCNVMRGDEAKVREMLAQNPNALDEGPLARDLVYDAVLWIVCQTIGADNFHERNTIAEQHQGLLSALLDAGADVNDFKFSGESALQLASRDRLPSLVQLLQEHGATL